MVFTRLIGWFLQHALDVFSFLAMQWVFIVWPIYASLKMLRRRKKDEEKIRRYLCFWLCMGILLGVECFTWNLITFMPLYAQTKFVFCIWLQYDDCKNSTRVVTRIFPAIERRRSEIQRGVTSAKKLTRETSERISEQGTRFLKSSLEVAQENLSGFAVKMMRDRVAAAQNGGASTPASGSTTPGEGSSGPSRTMSDTTSPEAQRASSLSGEAIGELRQTRSDVGPGVSRRGAQSASASASASPDKRRYEY